MRMVSGSMISSLVTRCSLPAVRLSLLGTVGSRARLDLTEAASSVLPSWHFTPGRSLNSHVRSSTRRQLSAMSGIRWDWASSPMRLS